MVKKIHQATPLLNANVWGSSSQRPDFTAGRITFLLSRQTVNNATDWSMQNVSSQIQLNQPISCIMLSQLSQQIKSQGHRLLNALKDQSLASHMCDGMWFLTFGLVTSGPKSQTSKQCNSIAVLKKKKNAMVLLCVANFQQTFHIWAWNTMFQTFSQGSELDQ